MTRIGTMSSGLLKLTPRFKSDKAVDRHKAYRYAKPFIAWRQFITLMYARIKGKDSLAAVKRMRQKIDPGSRASFTLSTRL